MITKIISGGQTGADQGGLFAGRKLGIKTGGTAPPNFMTEEGPKISFLQSYGLVEGESDSKTYPKRTKRNILDSDGTIIFGNMASPGSKLTLNLCRELKKPWISNPNRKTFLRWIDKNNIKVLNVAGNRASRTPNIHSDTYIFLIEALVDNNEASNS